MRPGTKRHKLFETTAIGLEYMVVDRDTLRVLPIAGRILGENTAIEHGDPTWSSERVAHVLEVRTAKPAKKTTSLHRKIGGGIRVMNTTLARHNAMLLPTAAHPFMDPATEAVIQPHGHNGAYALYERIFGCRTHGWSNGQAALLDIPFANDEEFSKLHAAVRLLLPIIPALSAGSPILDGHATGFLDARMEAYLLRQREVPELMGALIPEAVFSQEEYYRTIFSPIAQALAAYGPEHLPDHHSTNARGAIALFDRGVIRINIIGTQECPGADLAIAELIVAVLKALTTGRWVSTYLQRAWSEYDLLPLLLQTIKDGGAANIANRDYLLMFGLMKQEYMSAQKLWQHLFVELYGDLGENCRKHIAHILEHGCLAARILTHTGRTPDHDKLKSVYGELARCLAEDRAFA